MRLGICIMSAFRSRYLALTRYSKKVDELLSQHIKHIVWCCRICEKKVICSSNFVPMACCFARLQRQEPFKLALVRLGRDQGHVDLRALWEASSPTLSEFVIPDRRLYGTKIMTVTKILYKVGLKIIAALLVYDEQLPMWLDVG